MNEERVAELVQRLLQVSNNNPSPLLYRYYDHRINLLYSTLSCMQADKVIAEQQLGYNWYPPTGDLFKLELESPVETISPLIAPGMYPSSSILQTPFFSHSYYNTMIYTAQKDVTVVNDNMKEVVSLICDEAGFLVIY